MIISVLIFLTYLYKDTIVLLWKNRMFFYKLFNKKIFNNNNNNNNNNNSNTVIFNDTHIHITYYLDNDPHSLRVPYNPKNKNKFHRMILIKTNDDDHKGEGHKDESYIEVDITHKHGIPYLLTARELGGLYIVKRVAGEELSRFEIDELPKV